MNNNIIEAKNVGKSFLIGKTKSYNTLRDLISESPANFLNILPRRNTDRKFWALRNVSFDLKRGDVMGIIGPNGAGKSTLLKILARIILPSTGQIAISGKTASMLEVGTGFHSELTGRENIFLNGAILGMKRSEIIRKFDKIVEFSDIKEFLDVPVKKYSSGMQVRLAFSVAAHLDPEILLIDEVLAVGDMAFQRKSFEKMYSIAKDEGRTIILVSHNMSAIESLCNKTLLLEKGVVRAYGDTSNVISKYTSDYSPKKQNYLTNNSARSGSGKIRITDFWMENEKGARVNFVKSGDKCKFVFSYENPENKVLEDADFGFAVSTLTEQALFLNYISYMDSGTEKYPPKGRFVFEFEKLPLAEGEYKIGFRATVKSDVADYLQTAFFFSVQNGNYYGSKIAVSQNHSPLYVNGNWKIERL